MNKLALFGGTPVRKKKFKHSTIIGDSEKKSVLKLLKKGKLSGFFENFLGGPEVRKFEKKWAKFFKCKYAVAVNSGTSAQHIALASCGIKKGDEVILTALSFTSTVSTILMNNAKPVFCDIDKETFNIDINKIEKLVTNKTKAIVPVHLYGVPAKMDKLMKIARKYNLKVIEDTCQSPGSKFKKKYVGTIGNLGTFSTVETKNISTGEGGVIVSNDKNLINKCRLIRNHGESYLLGQKRSYLPNILGYNLRPTEFQAVIGIEQLKKLKKFNNIRNKLGKFIIKNLKSLKGIKVPLTKQKNSHIVHHLICLQYNELETGVSKERYMKALEKEGVNVSKGYPFTLYAIYYGFKKKGINFKKGLCPNAEKVIKKSIWINQLRPPATINDAKDIIKAFRKVNNNLIQLQDL